MCFAMPVAEINTTEIIGHRPPMDTCLLRGDIQVARMTVGTISTPSKQASIGVRVSRRLWTPAMLEGARTP